MVKCESLLVVHDYIEVKPVCHLISLLLINQICNLLPRRRQNPHSFYKR